jgi:mannose-1-phosphate guanylyltransferase / mannose-6-phosphate isomerase
VKIILCKNTPLISASHEDPKNPGVKKRILLTKDDFPADGRIQMVNWAVLPIGHSFARHYHEDMDEVFILTSGAVTIEIDGEKELMHEGDTVFVPFRAIHTMKNIGRTEACYVVIGVSRGKGGKTVVTND